MLELEDLDIILDKMDKNNKLSEFIYYILDYKIESPIKEYYVQHIEGDIILYIYEKKETHNLLSFEFTTGICEEYMDKSFYKNTYVNTIYVNKCLDLYDNQMNNKIINYCKAMNTNNIEEQKEILSVYIPEELIKIMYEK